MDSKKEMISSYPLLAAESSYLLPLQIDLLQVNKLIDAHESREIEGIL